MADTGAVQVCQPRGGASAISPLSRTSASAARGLGRFACRAAAAAAAGAVCRVPGVVKVRSAAGAARRGVTSAAVMGHVEGLRRQ